MTRVRNRTATALVAAAFVLTAGAGVASAVIPSDSFNATVGSANLGPLSTPGVGAHPSGVDLGGLRVSTPFYPAG
ncbi:hypothetical protein [Rhodococcus sp. NPDC058514]|uniref:hypothetical protein n=1 Tax=unclassified Rhodococcus (in: high G+C Gram-positive bacteria) TaxID=192944 RepID=UPI003659F0FF